MEDDVKYRYGFKALDQTGCTYFEGQAFVYNLPRRGEQWALTEHPEPGQFDGNECGPGGLHVHNRLSLEYGPPGSWPWFARYRVEAVLGSSEQKTRVTQMELRRIHPRVLARALRPPFNWGKGANLRWANLSGADLYGADLSGADLSGADLSEVDLSEVDLCEADLYRAYLRGADLSGANLDEANWNKYTTWPDGFEPPKGGSS